MGFKMKGPTFFNKKSPMKKVNDGDLRSLEKGELKPIAGTTPGAPKLIYETGKAIVKGHTKLHNESEGVRKATKATNLWSMGSMK